MQESRRSNEERSDAMRAALLGAGRKLFLAKGYAATGTPEIVAAAGVTRGALYHHFADKAALFAAVVEAESAAVAVAIETDDGLAPLQALQRGSEVFLAAMQDAGRVRLLLVDGPAVLGRGAMDAIDARHGGRTLREGLAAALPPGAPVAHLAALASAAHDRAAMMIAAGADAAEVTAALRHLMQGICAR